jgi:ferredoxin-NADP reductase/MOSC domain-containing protein YiiM
VASLLSVNVGLPKDVPWQGKTVHTGIWKASVPGPRTVRRLNIEGDGQGDTAGHGGENRAVMVYQIESYQHWQQQFGRDDFEYGEFGENFTVDGMADTEVCIGDRFRIGTAEFEVTQPRVTCFRVGMRLGVPDMASLLVSHKRPGFYLRVITEGVIEAGDEIVKTSSGPHQISVADIDALLYLPNRDLDLMRQALEIPALSPGWQGSFRELLEAGSASGPAIGVEPGWVGFKPLRVTRVVKESSAVRSFYLEAADGSPLPPALPGQYLTLRVGGAGSPAPVRNYSLSSGPRSGTYRLSIKSESHGLVSRYLHSQVQPGTLIDAAAPRGDFVLRDGAAPVVLISAGIGVTPVIAMLQQLVFQQAEREVWWIHAARNERENALADEAHSLLAALPHGHEYVCYSAANAVAGPDIRRGRLTAAELMSLELPVGGAAYVCGPSGFMADVRQALETIGLPAGQIYTELFGALGAINPGVVNRKFVPPHQPPGEPGTGPLITFARSGLSTQDDTAHRSLLETAELCDVPTRFSCRTGVCHTCVTPLLSGEIAYSPTPLELPASGDVLVCVARPVTDVVLDM